MNIVERARKGEDGILVIGQHVPIVQSILDLDFLSGKQRPSVRAIIAGTRKAQKYFFGRTEILIPCFKDVSRIPASMRKEIVWMLNMQSGRRTLESTEAFFTMFPHALGGHLFAENVPESHATTLIGRFGKRYAIAGPSGVGILVPGHLKLGAIGGVDIAQLHAGKLHTAGSVAVVSTSGGMTNELLRAVITADKRVSFSISIGGDRFPVMSLEQVLLLAEKDRATRAVVYFGELGGEDEYEIVRLRERGAFTKPVICYIAGIIDEAFEEHMQFGHAKALVARKDESARAKREALRAAGAIAPDSFAAFIGAIRDLPLPETRDRLVDMNDLSKRTPRRVIGSWT